MKVPFNKTFYTGDELTYIEDALKRGQLTGDGYYTRLVSSLLEERFGIQKVVLTTSATHALEMATLLIGLQPGDEVIMPSFTFASTANAVALRGAKPIFAEIREDTLNIDLNDLERKITQKTKAIIPVHYAGISCEMDKISELAAAYQLFVIEDAAQGVNAKYQNKYLGTFGDIGCYSFHGTKDYISGEGGAIAINNQQLDFIQRAEIIAEKGTDRSRFLRGEIERYSWIDLGSSYRPSELLIAFLYGQLKEMEQIKSRRKLIFEYYQDQLKIHLRRGLIKRMPTVPKDCEPNYHLFYLLFSDGKLRDEVLFQLKKKGIAAVFHYIPLHSSPKGRELGYKVGDLPITEEIGRCLIRLPLYTGMTGVEMEYVVTELTNILGDL